MTVRYVGLEAVNSSGELESERHRIDIGMLALASCPGAMFGSSTPKTPLGSSPKWKQILVEVLRGPILSRQRLRLTQNISLVTYEGARVGTSTHRDEFDTPA